MVFFYISFDLQFIVTCMIFYNNNCYTVAYGCWYAAGDDNQQGKIHHYKHNT